MSQKIYQKHLEMPISTARAIMREYEDEEDYIDAHYKEQAYPTPDGVEHRDNSIELSMRWRAARAICARNEYS